MQCSECRDGPPFSGIPVHSQEGEGTKPMSETLCARLYGLIRMNQREGSGGKKGASQLGPLHYASVFFPC
jgi:hypothetical protein